MLLALPLMAFAESRINDPDVKSLQVVVNDNWLAPAIMRLDSHDVLTVSFDELSHDYHRYIYKLEHCEADWTPSEGIFESDWLSGFNGNTIDDYQHSTNTIIPYTHYQLQLPNARCSLKISGNYRLHVGRVYGYRAEDEAKHERHGQYRCRHPPEPPAGLYATRLRHTACNQPR